MYHGPERRGEGKGTCCRSWSWCTVRSTIWHSHSSLPNATKEMHRAAAATWEGAQLDNPRSSIDICNRKLPHDTHTLWRLGSIGGEQGVYYCSSELACLSSAVIANSAFR